MISGERGQSLQFSVFGCQSDKLLQSLHAFLHSIERQRSHGADCFRCEHGLREKIRAHAKPCEQQNLAEESTQLQLEQGTWATNKRVEAIASRTLGMRPPDAATTVVVTLAAAPGAGGAKR